MPGLNTDLNDEDVVAASRLKYVQALQDNGTFVVNTAAAVAPPQPVAQPEEAPEQPEEALEPEPEPEPEEKPKKKRKPRKKKSKF